MKTREQVREEFYGLIRELLYLDAEQVVPNARFVEDLDGESIDLLELSFVCEKHFGTKIEFHKAVPAEKVQTDANGRLTPDGLTYIQTTFPSIDLSEFARDPHITRILELLTVEALSQVLIDTLERAGQLDDSGPALPIAPSNG